MSTTPRMLPRVGTKHRTALEIVRVLGKVSDRHLYELLVLIYGNMGRRSVKENLQRRGWLDVVGYEKHGGRGRPSAVYTVSAKFAEAAKSMSSA